MIDLFNQLDKTQAGPKPDHNQRCRDCMHGYEHAYGNMFYCSKQFQRGTAYGHKKIKKLQPACSMFETNKPQQDESNTISKKGS